MPPKQSNRVRQSPTHEGPPPSPDGRSPSDPVPTDDPRSPTGSIRQSPLPYDTQITGFSTSQTTNPHPHQTPDPMPVNQEQANRNRTYIVHIPPGTRRLLLRFPEREGDTESSSQLPLSQMSEPQPPHDVNSVSAPAAVTGMAQLGPAVGVVTSCIGEASESERETEQAEIDNYRQRKLSTAHSQMSEPPSPHAFSPIPASAPRASITDINQPRSTVDAATDRSDLEKNDLALEVKIRTVLERDQDYQNLIKHLALTSSHTTSTSQYAWFITRLVMGTGAGVISALDFIPPNQELYQNSSAATRGAHVGLSYLYNVALVGFIVYKLTGNLPLNLKKALKKKSVWLREIPTWATTFFSSFLLADLSKTGQFNTPTWYWTFSTLFTWRNKLGSNTLMTQIIEPLFHASVGRTLLLLPDTSWRNQYLLWLEQQKFVDSLIRQIENKMKAIQQNRGLLANESTEASVVSLLDNSEASKMLSKYTVLLHYLLNNPPADIQQAGFFLKATNKTITFGLSVIALLGYSGMYKNALSQGSGGFDFMTGFLSSLVSSAMTLMMVNHVGNAFETFFSTRPLTFAEHPFVMLTLQAALLTGAVFTAGPAVDELQNNLQHLNEMTLSYFEKFAVVGTSIFNSFGMNGLSNKIAGWLLLVNSSQNTSQYIESKLLKELEGLVTFIKENPEEVCQLLQILHKKGLITTGETLQFLTRDADPEGTSPQTVITALQQSASEFQQQLAIKNAYNRWPLAKRSLWQLLLVSTPYVADILITNNESRSITNLSERYWGMLLINATYQYGSQIANYLFQTLRNICQATTEHSDDKSHPLLDHPVEEEEGEGEEEKSISSTSIASASNDYSFWNSSWLWETAKVAAPPVIGAATESALGWYFEMLGLPTGFAKAAGTAAATVSASYFMP